MNPQRVGRRPTSLPVGVSGRGAEPAGSASPIDRKTFYKTLSERTGVTQVKLRGVLAVVRELAVEQLESAGQFEVPGLCRFTLRTRSPRRYTLGGSVRHLPSRRQLQVKPSKKLSDLFYSLESSVDVAMGENGDAG